MTLAAEVRAAYDASGAAWGHGPTEVYAALARPLVAACGDVRGRRVLDVGTGGGAVASLLQDRGADVVACDGSLGMLTPHAAARPPAVVADALGLPFSTGSVDVAVAGFVLNHLPEPVPAVREMARVVRPGGRVVATTFAGEAAGAVKEHLDAVAHRHGWVEPEWYVALRDGPLRRPTTATAYDVLAGAGLVNARVERVVVRLQLTADQVLAWRWGMAHLAPFRASLTPAQRRALNDEARAGLDLLSALSFPVLVLTGQRSCC